MIPYYGDWKVRKGDMGLALTPFGYVYFTVLQVKSNGNIFAHISPSNTNKSLRKSIKRVINLNYGFWKLI